MVCISPLRLYLAGRVIIANCVILASIFFFVIVWTGTTQALKHIWWLSVRTIPCVPMLSRLDLGLSGVVVGCSPTGEVATLSERLLVLCIVVGIRCLSGCSFFFFIFLSLSLFPFPFLACCFVWAGRTGLASISVTSRSKGSFYLCQKKTKKKKKNIFGSWLVILYGPTKKPKSPHE
jgi:hypothetical protein